MMIDFKTSKQDQDKSFLVDGDAVENGSLSLDPEKWGTELKVAMSLCFFQCIFFYFCRKYLKKLMKRERTID